MTNTQRESKLSSLPVSRPETKAQPKETLAGYYPLFDCCWGLDTQFQLPEGDTLKAVMFIPETRELVGIIEKNDSIKFYSQRIKIETLIAANSPIFNPKQEDVDHVTRLLMPCNVEPVYVLFRDETHGDCVAVSDILSYKINIWKLTGELIQVLEDKIAFGGVIALAKLNSHQLVSLHREHKDPIKLWDLSKGKRLNSVGVVSIAQLSLLEDCEANLSILSDGRIVMALQNNDDSETRVFVWLENELTQTASIAGYFLCEITNGLVVRVRNHIVLLDSGALNSEAIYSAAPKSLTVAKPLRRFCSPIAIPQPNGCINLITMSAGYESISEIFSPTLEKMGKFTYCSGDIENACPVTNAPFAFYQSAGKCLGHFMNYSSYYRKLLQKVLEPLLFKDIHPIVMGYAMGDTCTSLQTIPLPDLKQFSTQLITCLNDEEKFPLSLNNPVGRFVGLFVSAPAVHASAKNNLISQVQNLLKKVEDPLMFERDLANLINQFWVTLNEAASVRYKNSLAKFLQLEDLNQVAPSAVSQKVDDFPSRLSVSLLRCLMASIVGKIICRPVSDAKVSDEMKEAKGTKVFVIKTDIKTVSLPDEEAKETKDIIFYSKPVFTSADTFVRACGHFPASFFRALQSYRIVDGQTKALTKKSLPPKTKIFGLWEGVDELRYMPLNKDQGYLYCFKGTSYGLQFIALDSKKLTNEDVWNFFNRRGLHTLGATVCTTKHGIRFSPSNQMVAMQIVGNEWLKGTTLVVYDYSSASKAVIYLGEDRSQCYDYTFCSEKPIAIAFLIKNLRGYSSKLALHIGTKTGYANVLQYSSAIPLPIEYDKKAEKQDFRLIFWPGSAFFAVASTEQDKIWFLHLQSGWLGESVVLIKEFNGQLKRDQSAEYLFDNFLIFHDKDSNQIIGYNPIIDAIVQFGGLNPDCDSIVVSTKGVLLLKGNQMTCMTSLPALETAVLKDHLVNQIAACNIFSRDLVGLMAAYAGNGFFDVGDLPSSLSPACPIKENREVKFTPV